MWGRRLHSEQQVLHSWLQGEVTTTQHDLLASLTLSVSLTELWEEVDSVGRAIHWDHFRRVVGPYTWLSSELPVISELALLVESKSSTLAALNEFSLFL